MKRNYSITVIFLSILIFNGFIQPTFYQKLAEAALSLTHQKVIYDPTYTVIPYPNGDVSPQRGVCTDVIIRAYRKMGVDLQKEVHEDMKSHFKKYPQKWGLKSPDKNIDHRRVPNLMTYFSRFGIVKPITKNAQDYTPGDIVCWQLSDRLTHIGLVSSKKTIGQQRYLIVHNIGSGQVLEDCLFSFKIIGHYQYSNKTH